MAKENNLKDFLTDVADAIREKEGSTGLINPQEFSERIRAIETGGGVPSYPIGIYIQHIDGRLFKTEEWTLIGYPNDEANGVAVVSDACRYVITKTERQYTSWQTTATLIEGVATFTSLESAITDFDGVNNTNLMTGSIAKSYCSEYTFPNGQQGYLGSAGEWNEFLKNYNAVDSAMTSIGGESFFGGKKYWTSTQESQSNAWICTMITKLLYAELKTYHTSVEYARPFGKI